jgi:ribose 5-phosphate isomerase B
MKIFIASDHAGFELKGTLIPYLQELGCVVEDKGPFAYDAVDDYPDFIKLVAEVVDKGGKVRGVIIGKSGQGEAMQANRFKGVRAAVYYGGNMEIVKLSREHNDSNILSLAAGFVSEEEAKSAIKLWLETPFSEEARHVRRINKLDE